MSEPAIQPLAMPAAPRRRGINWYLLGAITLTLEVDAVLAIVAWNLVT